MKRFLIPAAFATLASSAPLAFAQDAPVQTTPAQVAPPAEDGWDVFRDPNRSMLMAYADFGSGLGVAVRCVGHSYEAVITGLPAVRTRTRPIGLLFSTHDQGAQRWNVAQDGTVAASSFPAPFARALRQGGQLHVVLPDAAEGGRDLRYVLDLPSSGALVDETLSACGLPTSDPRDALIPELGANGLPPGLVWRERPRALFFPERDRQRLHTRGFSVLTCMAGANGRLSDCKVESEYPSGSGFGEAALSGVDTARLGAAARGAPVEPGLISFRMEFELDGFGGTQRSGGLPHADTPN
ncbi:hypothetical protein BH09PSE1_BH09PSE1_29470 [soil metagenome]